MLFIGVVAGLVVELRTNHRSEGSLIFDNATKISNQRLPVFDKDGGFRLIVPGNDVIPAGAARGAAKLEKTTDRPLGTVERKKV